MTHHHFDLVSLNRLMYLLCALGLVAGLIWEVVR